MQTIINITTRFSEIGYQPNLGKIAFNDLAKSLRSDETILNVVEGAISNTLGIAIATDYRVFYVGVNKHHQPVLEQLIYDDIVGIEVTKSMFVSVELIVQTKSKKEIRLKGCDPERAAEMVELINLLIRENS
ncbi:MAG: PH domain-containing protein [Sporocytophaga sp.]|jgi:hypothetical protein|nr:PH domain-containing protein [Sporocytophaga sp.]